MESIALTYVQARQAKDERLWHALSSMTIEEAIDHWLELLQPLTAKTYRSAMRKLIEHNLIKPQQSLQDFALVNHDAVIDRIKEMAQYSESTKQSRAGCYISFTRYLSRRTKGIIVVGVPNMHGSQKTFGKIRDKVSTPAMTRAQWCDFLSALHTINRRDCLIAKLILQGAKRKSEVLKLTIDKINFDKCEISFAQSKTRGCFKETVITYPREVMEELKAYIGVRSGLVFITKKGKSLAMCQLANTFARAGVKARLPFKIFPHVLRASAVTYFKSSGFHEGEIMKITGHTSVASVMAYDKGDLSENITKKVSLV